MISLLCCFTILHVYYVYPQYCSSKEHHVCTLLHVRLPVEPEILTLCNSGFKNYKKVK
jgi:hypothetical protein